MFFQCASTNRNILILSSIWPVKSTRFFWLECANRGSFWRNYVLPYGICGQNCIYTWIYCLLYVHVLSNNPFYWVYRWSPKKSEKTIPIASKENIRLIIFYSGLSCAICGQNAIWTCFFWYCIQQEPQKIRKTKSHSLEITYSVNYLLSDR